MPPNDPNQRTSTGTTTGSTTTKSNAPTTSNNNRGAGGAGTGRTQTGPGKTNSQVTTANKTSTTSPRTGARGPTGPQGQRKQGPGLAGNPAGNARVASGMPRTTNVTKTPAAPRAPSAKVQRPGVGRIAGDPRVSYTPVGSLAPQKPAAPAAAAAPISNRIAKTNPPPGLRTPPGAEFPNQPKVDRPQTAYEKFRTALDQDVQRLQKMQNQPPTPGRMTRAARTPIDGNPAYAQEPNLTSYVNTPRAPKIADQWPGLPADPVRPSGQAFVNRAYGVTPPAQRPSSLVAGDPRVGLPTGSFPAAPPQTAATRGIPRPTSAPPPGAPQRSIFNTNPAQALGDLRRQAAVALGPAAPPARPPTEFNLEVPPVKIAGDPRVGLPTGAFPSAPDPSMTMPGAGSPPNRDPLPASNPGSTVAVNDPFNPMQEGEYPPGESPSQVNGQPQSLSELMNRIGYERDQVKQGWNDLPGKLWDAITNGDISGNMNVSGNPFGHRTGGGQNNPLAGPQQGLDPAMIQQLIAMLQQQQQTGAATSQAQLQQILSTFV